MLDFEALMKRARSGAKARGLVFDVNAVELYQIMIMQNWRCALSGQPIGVGPNANASLDRVDSGMGYTLDNVQWLHRDVNLMKQAFMQEYFVDTCRMIADYQRVKSDSDQAAEIRGGRRRRQL